MRPPMNVKKSWKMSKHARICLGSAELSSILSRPRHVGWRSSIWRQDFPRSSIRLERQPVSLLSSSIQRGKGKIELWITLIWYFYTEYGMIMQTTSLWTSIIMTHDCLPHEHGAHSFDCKHIAASEDVVWPDVKSNFMVLFFNYHAFWHGCRYIQLARNPNRNQTN